MTQKNKKILIIIPAFNEEASIGKVIDGIRECLPEADIVIVNDGSKDKTSQLAREKGTVVLDLPYNMGIGAAMQTGYIFAKQNGYNLACQVDGDGQHCPEELKRLIEPILNGKCDMVIGSRYLKKNGFQSTLPRRIGSRFLSLVLLFITGKKITDPTSGFRAVNKNLIDIFAEEYPSDYPEPEALIQLHKKNLNYQEIPATMHKRESGTSSINTMQAVYYMIKVTLSLIIGMIKSYK